MISASLTYSIDKCKVALIVEGHAGQAEKGHDIVCASASILAYTVAQYVRYVQKLGGMKTKPLIELKDGYMYISVCPTEKYFAEVLNAFFVAEVGYSLLAHNYPQYVELNVFGKV